MNDHDAMDALGSGEDLLGALTPRESELLRKAGERIFALSRKLGECERDKARTEAELLHLREMLEETRRTRDVLSNQVMALQRDSERDYDERAELRRLLASLQMQLQALLSTLLANPPGASPQGPLALRLSGRAAPQRGSGPRPSSNGTHHQAAWVTPPAGEFGKIP